MSLQPTFCRTATTSTPGTLSAKRVAGPVALRESSPRLPGLSPIAYTAWMATEPYQQ